MSLIRFLSSVLTILLYISIQCGESSHMWKRVTVTIAAVESCNCAGLRCTCCVSLNPENPSPNTGCLKAEFVPSDLALKINILANGVSVYQTKIDSGNFPICAPIFPPACWAFNRIHIGIDSVQVCSEVRIGPVPIIKVPCLAYVGGNLVASPNIY